MAVPLTPPSPEEGGSSLTRSSQAGSLGAFPCLEGFIAVLWAYVKPYVTACKKIYLLVTNTTQAVNNLPMSADRVRNECACLGSVSETAVLSTVQTTSQYASRTIRV